VIARTSIVEATEIGLAELDAALRLLRSLERDDWARPTDCTGWTVRDVVAHMIGQFEGAARPDRMLRRIRAAKRMPGVSVLEGHNRLQVTERAGVPAAELVEQLAYWGRRGIRTLGRMPAPLRRTRVSLLFPEARGMVKDSMDYLIRVIGPRDPWMHRIDVAMAVGRSVEPETHDGVIVEQVVRDFVEAWAGPAVTLRLDGPAGGKWLAGQGIPVAQLHADAIEFCRHVSGRPSPQPVVSGEATVGAQLIAARVVF
jgi:uncharacterized protein (TIGR03083 family)